MQSIDKFHAEKRRDYKRVTYQVECTDFDNDRTIGNNCCSLSMKNLSLSRTSIGLGCYYPFW